MLTHRIAEFFEFSVDGPLPKRRIVTSGIEENVEVLGEPLNEVPPFGKAGSPFENHAIARSLGNLPERLGDEIVLLDQRGAQPLGLEMLRGPEDRLREIRMLEEFHGTGAPSPAKRAQ